MTIGNATLIALDGRPILSTDPWLGDEDEAYFGSWSLSHTISHDQKELIKKSEYHWYSHGHPDHLNPHSVTRYHGNKILLPDHVGSRIKNYLELQGHRVTVLPERRWVEISPNIKVMCISDFIQDAILLIDINGKLFLNLNDSGIRGCKKFLQRIAIVYKDVYLLKQSGYGNVDMINIFDESGCRVEPYAIKKPKIGKNLSGFAKKLHANHVIPFSSFHKYTRKDSIWAEKYSTPLAAYVEGFDHSNAEYISPFVYINCASKETFEIDPSQTAENIRLPEDFGDVWSDDLESCDKKIISNYFQRKELLHRYYGFLRFKVGGTLHAVSLRGPRKRGITFEVPRNSLMLAINNEIFDDLLIGNFMRVTFHNVRSLYAPNFTYVVAKYADNGCAQRREEVESYLREYALRAHGEWLTQMFVERSAQLFRNYVRSDTLLYGLGRCIHKCVR